MCAFHYRWFITDGLLHGLHMVYCVVYCRCSHDYDSHLNCNDDPTCAVVSRMTADGVGIGTVHTDRKPNANSNLFFKKNRDIRPFCGATHTPVLGFRWCLLSVLKPEWAALFAPGGGVRNGEDVRLKLKFTAWNPIPIAHCEWTLKHCSHWSEAAR